MPPSRGWFTALDVPADLLDECHDAVRAVRTGSPVDGLRFARAILRKAREGGDPGSIIEAHLTLANCQGAHGDFIEACANAIDAFDLAQANHDRVGCLNALTTLAGASGFILDSLEPAADLLGQCIRAADELGEGALGVRARNIRGVVYSNLQRFGEAGHDFEQARARISEGGTNTPLRLVAANTAHALVKHATREEGRRREDLWAQAQQLIDSTLADAAREGDLDGQSRLRFMLGEMLIQKGEVAAALDQFVQARKLGLEMKHRTRAIDALLEIAKTHALMGNSDLALKEFSQACDEASDLKPTRILAEANERMAALHEAEGRKDEAARFKARSQAEAAEYQRESRRSRAHLLAFYERIDAGQGARGA